MPDPHQPSMKTLKTSAHALLERPLADTFLARDTPASIVAILGSHRTLAIGAR
jgi:hypothetical protein